MLLKELQHLDLIYHTDSQDIKDDLKTNNLEHLADDITATLTTYTGLIVYLTESSKPYSVYSIWENIDYYTEEDPFYTCPNCFNDFSEEEIYCLLQNNEDWVNLLISCKICPLCSDIDLF